MAIKKIEYSAESKDLENIDKIIKEFSCEMKIDNPLVGVGFDGKILYHFKIYPPYPNGKVTLFIFRIGDKEVIEKEESDVEKQLKKI